MKVEQFKITVQKILPAFERRWITLQAEDTTKQASRSKSSQVDHLYNIEVVKMDDGGIVVYEVTTNWFGEKVKRNSRLRDVLVKAALLAAQDI